MYRRALLILAVCMGLALTSFVHAAPTSTAKDDADDFAKAFRQYKSLIARLTQLKERYKSGGEADKKALEDEFNAKVEEAKAIEPKLAATAEAAYLVAPNKDSDINEYLFAYLSSLVSSDNYEKAAKLVKTLVEHDFKHKYFDYTAGMALFATNDFDDAGKHFELAKAAQEIDSNGLRYSGQIDRYKKLWEREQAFRAKDEKAEETPQALPKVKLATSKGDIVIELFEDEAPIATSNFITLVEKKFYDGLSFHRVLPGFMAQGGDPKGDGSGGPGYTIPCECEQEKHRDHFRGSLSMAHAGKDTGGSQFFLTFLPTSHLDGKHTVFGRVVDGMEVLSKLQRCQPGDAGVPDKIVKATVLRKRKHRYDGFVKKPDIKKS